MIDGLKSPVAEVIVSLNTHPSLAALLYLVSHRTTWHPARSTVSLNRQALRMSDSPMRYAIVIEDAGSNYSAYVPDLPGCVATGVTLEEAEGAIREAIEFHLEGLRADGIPIPRPSSRVEYVEVAA